MQDKGENLYRRSLYVYRKRTVPHPAMANFDAPSREICQVKRARTNTPLQALELLNDVTYVEAANHLARRMLTEGGCSPRDRLAYGFRLATSRTPGPEELQVLERGLERYRKAFQADPRIGVAVDQEGESSDASRRWTPSSWPPTPQPPASSSIWTRRSRGSSGQCAVGSGSRQWAVGSRSSSSTAFVIWNLHLISFEGSMDELQIAQELNRRHFLARSGLGLGAIALGFAAGARRRRRRHVAPGTRPGGRPAWLAPLRSQGQAGDLPLPVRRTRRSSTCSTPSRRFATSAGIELPDSIRMGQRITTMTSGQKSLPVAPSIFQFAQHGRQRRLVERTLASHRHGCRRSLPHPLGSDRGNQPRSGDHVRADRLSACRPAQHGGLGGVWPGKHEPGPAGLRGDALAGPDRPAPVRPPLGQRLLAHAVPGREAAGRQGARALSGQSRPAVPVSCGGRCSTTSAS